MFSLPLKSHTVNEHPYWKQSNKISIEVNEQRLAPNCCSCSSSSVDNEEIEDSYCKTSKPTKQGYFPLGEITKEPIEPPTKKATKTLLSPRHLPTKDESLPNSESGTSRDSTEPFRSLETSRPSKTFQISNEDRNEVEKFKISFLSETSTISVFEELFWLKFTQLDPQILSLYEIMFLEDRMTVFIGAIKGIFEILIGQTEDLEPRLSQLSIFLLLLISDKSSIDNFLESFLFALQKSFPADFMPSFSPIISKTLPLLCQEILDREKEKTLVPIQGKLHMWRPKSQHWKKLSTKLSVSCLALFQSKVLDSEINLTEPWSLELGVFDLNIQEPRNFTFSLILEEQSFIFSVSTKEELLMWKKNLEVWLMSNRLARNIGRQLSSKKNPKPKRSPEVFPRSPTRPYIVKKFSVSALNNQKSSVDKKEKTENSGRMKKIFHMKNEADLVEN